MAYLDKAVLEKLGLTDKVDPRPAAIVASVAGLEGTGKTHWALTAPKPLFYMGTDFGDAGVVQKAEGQIIRPSRGDYKLEIPHEYRAFVDKTETSAERQKREGRLANFVHDNFYIPFYRDYSEAVKAGVRSVVWDTALEIWEWVRLSVYGREATNRSDLQQEANSKFKEMIRLANINNVNLIMINRLKNKWDSYTDQNGTVKWRKNENEWEMAGFDKAPDLVALSVWTKFTPPDGFELLVKKNRDHPNWVGQTVPALPFVELMSMLVPEVESWT
jgi:hypothetical protein